MRVTFTVPFLLVLTICSGSAADRVRAEDGRIVFEDSSGQKTALTQTGIDSDPWLSPDGRTVVFLRHSAEDMFRNSVYEIDMRTRIPKLMYAGPAKYQGREGSYFGEPELDGSHDKLLLISKEYATSGALISIQLANGQATLVSDEVVGYDVIECPKKYRGDLIALKRHEEDILGRPYFLYYLYSAVGQELGLAGDGELDADLDFLRNGSCEEPEPQPPPAPSHPLSPTVGDAIRMDGSAMDRQLMTRVEPTYPNQAQSEHIQGDVRLQVRVAADGTVQDVNLVSGPPQLVGAAIAAVKQWRYRPAISSGHPVAVVTIVSVPFRLSSTGK
jgi:TonB family protein